MKPGDDMRYEMVGDDVFVLDAGSGVVHRLSEDAAQSVRVATDEVSRRRALQMVLAAGAGVTTLALPTAAAASSGVGGSGGIGDGGGVAPNAPTNFAATEGDGQVVLSWTAPASGTVPTGYTITRTETYGAASPVVTAVNAATTMLTVTGLTNNTSYTFTLVATASGLSSGSVQVTATPTGIATLSAVSLLSEVMSRASAVTVSCSSQVGTTLYYSLDGGSEISFSPWVTVTGLTNSVHSVVVRRRRNSDNVILAEATVSLTKRDVTVTPSTPYVLRNPDSPYRVEQLSLSLYGGVGGRGGNATSGGTTKTGSSTVFQSRNTSAGFSLDRGDTLTFVAGTGGANGADTVDGTVSVTGGGAGGTNTLAGYDGGRGGDVGNEATTAGGGGGGGAATVARHYDASAGTSTDWVAPGYGGGGGAIIYSTVKTNGSTGGYSGTVFTVRSESNTDGAPGDNGVARAAGNGGGGAGVTGGKGGVPPTSVSNEVYYGQAGSRGSFSGSGQGFVSQSHSSSTAGTNGKATVAFYEITNVVQSV